MAQMTHFYNTGYYGYMGVGPTPNRSFSLTISILDNAYYYRWYSPAQVSKIGILLYKIGDTTKYAVHKTAYLTVTDLYGATYIIVSANNYDQTEEGVPGSQTLDISYNESDWDFFGGFTADDLKGAAMCFFVKDPSGMSGSAPNGTDYASIGNDLSQYIKFDYTEVQERFASTIDGSNIYAKRAECDSDGNPIITTYATKAELAGKQDVLTAGDNITIDSDGVISAAGGGETYTAGTGINIDSDGVISADIPEEEEVEFEELDPDDYQKKLTEGTGIDIDSDGNISVDSTIATKSYVDTAVQGKADSATTLSGYGITDAYTKTQVDNALNDKQNSLTGITDVQVVAALPASPVSTVLYLIPEV